jgi:hypothetical protein
MIHRYLNRIHNIQILILNLILISYKIRQILNQYQVKKKREKIVKLIIKNQKKIKKIHQIFKINKKWMKKIIKNMKIKNKLIIF